MFPALPPGRWISALNYAKAITTFFPVSLVAIILACLTSYTDIFIIIISIMTLLNLQFMKRSKEKAQRIQDAEESQAMFSDVLTEDMKHGV
jgi:predicted membrane protein